MPEAINISITKPETLTISGYPDGFAIMPKAGYTRFFVPEPNNDYAFSTASPEVLNVTNAISSYDGVGSFDCSGALNVTLGTLPYSTFASELDGFKFQFKNFELQESTYSQLSIGDLVYFKSVISGNAYLSTLGKADTQDVNKGAKYGLFIFLGYNINSKIVYAMSKGYFDYEQSDDRFQFWDAGRTVYLDNNNRLNISPASTSNAWVKSLGLCIPNKENKKRIWFDPDSTYLKIR
jgi:hypothetical protein